MSRAERMRSLPRIVKEIKEEHFVHPYDFFSAFQIVEEEQPEEEEEESLLETPQLVPAEIIEEAQAKADKIISDARAQADILRDRGYREGLAQGQQDGLREAYQEQRRLLDEQLRELEAEITEVLKSVTVEKEALLERYIDDLKRISLVTAEKIIHTSLQSSGDIVKRMILAATEKMTKKRWAKIYITKCNAAVSMEVDAEFLESLKHLSENIKIVTMDGEENDGTCIIELPDEIIDASVNTQLANIKDILNNVRI